MASEKHPMTLLIMLQTCYKCILLCILQVTL